MDSELVQGGPETTVTEAQVMRLWRSVKQLYPETEGTLMESLLSKAEGGSPILTNQGTITGEATPPVDFSAVIAFKTANPHHSRCLDTFVNAAVGLGFEVPKVHDVLDPLCKTTLQDLLLEIAEDYSSAETAYMEVVRAGEEIVALYHVQTPLVTRYNESGGRDYHYIIKAESSNKPDQVFCRFGEKKEFLKRAAEEDADIRMPVDEEIDPDEISELIQFRRPNSVSKEYGYPSWIAAVAFIELVQMLVQQKFDFFQNRGVPEFMLFFLGGSKIDPKTWASIETAMRATIGQGNQHKSIAVDLPDCGDKTLELHKLAMDSKADGNMGDQLDPLSMAIVSAHGVPPLLAGIQVPGKLGANNELPNALKGYQLLKIGPAQRSIASRFANTLGASNGVEGLGPKDFLPDPEKDEITGKMKKSTGFNKVTDEMDLDQMETSLRMRQTEPEAAAQGRDMSAGLKD